MFALVPRTVKAMGRRFLARHNLALVRRNCVTAGKEFLRETRRRLGIDLVIDVGANNGCTGTELRREGYTGRIVSFEPQAQEFCRLQEAARGDGLWECQRLALGDTHDMVWMEISGYSPSSTLLKLGQKHVQLCPQSAAVRTEKVPVAQLDRVAGTMGLERHKTLLKIDVQGYELPVLRGAAKTLRHIAAAYVELDFAPLFEGQSKYYEVMGLLEQAGLAFAGLFDVAVDPQSGYPIFADGLFIRNLYPASRA
jgi:FkbM family methyltransferase